MFTFIYIVIMLFVTTSLAAMYLEKRDFNDGICKICGNLLRNFDDDSQGITLTKIFNQGLSKDGLFYILKREVSMMWK